MDNNVSVEACKMLHKALDRELDGLHDFMSQINGRLLGLFIAILITLGAVIANLIKG